MRRRALTFAAVMSLLVGATALPAAGAIHEIVASHCSGYPNLATIDPHGQFDRGSDQSFLRALQASGVYDLQFGVSQEGVPGLDLTTNPPTFGPMPGPVVGTTPVTVFVDNTRPNAKLAEDFTWGYIVDPELGVTVYIQLYDLDHPAFENCANLNT